MLSAKGKYLTMGLSGNNLYILTCSFTSFIIIFIGLREGYAIPFFCV